MLLLLLAAALAAPAPMPVDQVVRGMRGECLTVFEGTTIEPFAFEVKGVMRDYLGPGRHLVLTRLLGDKPNFTGVVAGMSGSPCSIDGKLLGALAYAFATFAKEPIAGITPIGSMTDILELPAEAHPFRLATGDADAAGWAALAAGRAPPAAAAAGSDDAPRPIATPLMLGGVPPAVQQQFAPWLRQAGFEPIAGGSSGGGSPLAPKTLVPGGSIAAVLVRGDVDVAATGTVTWVDGPHVLGFGHPFMGAGAVSLPMASADILNTMSSAQRSFKMSATGPVLGELTQDRLTAIGGRLGPAPRMIPVGGKVTTPAGSSRFALEVARDPALAPRLTAMALSSALTGRTDVGERGLVRLDGEVRVAGLPPVPVRNVYAAQRDSSLMGSAAIDVARAFAALWDTPFGPAPEVALRLDAVVEAEPVEEVVEALYVDRTQVRPGAALELTVRLRRDGQAAPGLEHVHLDVPRAWAGQSIELLAAGYQGAEALDHRGSPLRPTSYAHIAEVLRRRRGDGALYVLASRAGFGVHAAVADWAFLPPSVVALVSGDPSKSPLAQSVAWEARRPRPGTVAGQAHATVQVLPN